MQPVRACASGGIGAPDASLTYHTNAPAAITCGSRSTKRGSAVRPVTVMQPTLFLCVATGKSIQSGPY